VYISLKDSVSRFGEDLDATFSENKFVVFLCGPSLSDLTVPGAQLRKYLIDVLEAEDFEVVLGEDDGLENIRNDYSGYAHENELQFIRGHCNAVVLIASSVGSFCELGLFSYSHVHQQNSQIDFILILDEQYRDVVSYLSEGPAAALEDFGKVFHADLASFDHGALLKRLSRRRHVFFTSKVGRPAEEKV